MTLYMFRTVFRP